MKRVFVVRDATYSHILLVLKNLSSISTGSKGVFFSTCINIHTDDAAVSDSSNMNITPTVNSTKTSALVDNPWLVGTSLVGEQSNLSIPNNHPTTIPHVPKEEKEHRKEQSKGNKTENNLSPQKEHKEELSEHELDYDTVSLSSEEMENEHYLRRAFQETGTDDHDFEKEKEREVEEEIERPEEETLVLPGWGTWGGAGIQEPRLSRYAERVKREQEKKKEAAKLKRKDSERGLEHVIISEKRVKQTAALTVPFVPAPMKSREEYETANRMPLGKEWLRLESYQKAIRPAIISPIGTPIKPLHWKRISGTRDEVRL